jgi:hypothetical protein
MYEIFVMDVNSPILGKTVVGDKLANFGALRINDPMW